MRGLARALGGLCARLAVAAGVATAPPAAAIEAAPAGAVAPVAGGLAAAKALNVLTTYCADCHQAGRSARHAPQGGLDNILDLAALAREPSLLRPGQPDASALYDRLLHGHAAAVASPPSATEIEAVRQWIEQLADPFECGERITQDGMVRAIAAWLREIGTEAARHTRFVTLGPLANACGSDAEMADHRGAVQELLRRMSTSSAPPPLHTIEDSLSILAVRLPDLGWESSRWEALAVRHPRGSAPAVTSDIERLTGSLLPVLRGDWLAHAHLRSKADGDPSSSPNDADSEQGSTGIGALLGLARRYERATDLRRAAAELLVSPAELSERLDTVTGKLQPLAMRLRVGLLPRPELERLLTSLRWPETLAQLADEEPSLIQRGFELALWPEKATYARGEVAAFYSEASADCHLTLVNVDPSGKATVLFPSELEPDNLLRAGTKLRVPGAAANYRFRFDEPGVESIIGICSTSPRAPDGIAHDFERQRFTVLGDWKAFLRDKADAVRAGRPAQGAAEARRPRPHAPHLEPQTRTAISVRVD